ncbi:MAG: hypothetical protein QW587_06340 [Candidatus Bathyarchaeia archaeon]
MAAALGSMALTAYATSSGIGTTNGAGTFNGLGGVCGWPRGGGRGRGPLGSIEVSEEYQQNVVNIASADADVKALLDQGYNITGVRPIITAKIDAEGNVVVKTTNATIMLQKNTAGWASVSVDLAQGKVTNITIWTVTVIEKP